MKSRKMNLTYQQEEHRIRRDREGQWPPDGGSSSSDSEVDSDSDSEQICWTSGKKHVARGNHPWHIVKIEVRHGDFSQKRH